MDAHCRAGRLDAALAVVQDFGSPDARMYDRLVDAAMRSGDFRCALKVRVCTQKREEEDVCV